MSTRIKRYAGGAVVRPRTRASSPPPPGHASWDVYVAVGREPTLSALAAAADSATSAILAWTREHPAVRVVDIGAPFVRSLGQSPNLAVTIEFNVVREGVSS